MQTDDYAIPIVKLWEHLLVPIQGEISDQQAANLLGDVLAAIQQTGAVSLLVDVSGVAVMDSHLCATLANLAASARLMGARSVISGLTPEIVTTLQTMGVALGDIKTVLSLEDALMLFGIGRVGTARQPVNASAESYPFAPDHAAPSTPTDFVLSSGAARAGEGTGPYRVGGGTGPYSARGPDGQVNTGSNGLPMDSGEPTPNGFRRPR